MAWSFLAPVIYLGFMVHQIRRNPTTDADPTDIGWVLFFFFWLGNGQRFIDSPGWGAFYWLLCLACGMLTVARVKQMATYYYDNMKESNDGDQ